MTWRAALLALNAVALLGALGWLYFDRDFEPFVTSAVCASGLIIHFAYQKHLGPLKLELFNGSPCEQTEPAGAVGRAIRIFSVAVTNQGGEHLDDCSVQLWHIKAVDGSHLETAYLPIELRTQHQHQSNVDGHFNLKARETKYIRVATMDETSDSSEIVLQYATDKVPNPIRRGDFIVTLRAFGAPSFAEDKFRLFISSDGQIANAQLHTEAKLKQSSQRPEKRTWRDVLVLSASPKNQNTVRRAYEAWRREQRLPLRCETEVCQFYSGPLECNGQALPLILDHLLGNRGDNTPGSLRFLCPNCDAQYKKTRGGANKGTIRDHIETGYTRLERDRTSSIVRAGVSVGGSKGAAVETSKKRSPTSCTPLRQSITEESDGN